VVRREGGLNKNRMMHLIVQVTNSEDGLPLEPGVLVQAELDRPHPGGSSSHQPP